MSRSFLAHALLTLYRAVTRHRLYAAINILGLAIGIAVFLVLTLDVKFETSFESWIPQAQKIAVLRTIWTDQGALSGARDDSMGGLLDELRAEFPHLEGTRIWDRGATVRQGANNTAEQAEVVDPSFFQVFDLPLVEGDKRSLLQRPDDLVLSQTKARQYFGSTSPLGRRLTLVLEGDAKDFRVAGVLKDVPKNTAFSFDFIAPMNEQMKLDNQPWWTHWGSTSLKTFLRFDTPAQARAFDAQMDGFTDRHGRRDLGPDAHKSMRLRTQPLLSLHLIEPKDAAMVATLGTVGALTLLLAAINYVNLATARAALRAKEVALRKVMGATTAILVAQFMAEAWATALVGALIGLALCELALPLVNAAGGLSLRMQYVGRDSVLPIVAAVVAVVGLGAGIYPALVLSRFQPAAVLAAARTPGGGRSGSRVREALVVVQFAVAIGFTVATGVMVSQASFLRHADLGFKRDGLVVVNSFDANEVTEAQQAALLPLWRAEPGVVGVTAADIAPGVDDYTDWSNFKRPGMQGDGPTLHSVDIGPDFTKTYQARVIAGRTLDVDHGLDDAPQPVTVAPEGSVPAPVSAPAPRNVLLDANSVRRLGFRSAQDAVGASLLEGEGVGKGFRPLTIVGVIDNLRFRTPHAPVPPTVYFMTTRHFASGVAGVRYAAADPKLMLARIEADWRHIAPEAPFRAKTIEESLQPYYKADDRQGRLFVIGSVLAVVIGCGGLYGLASFTTARRTREIGVRKTLGASSADVVRLLVGQFLRPVLLANLIAWPLAWIVMQGWLGGFDQRIALTPVYFLGAAALALAVALITVVGQALRVAHAEPARALRHE